MYLFLCTLTADMHMTCVLVQLPVSVTIYTIYL